MKQNLKSVWDSAREKLTGYCRVCRICDGRACAGEVPGMGGLGTGSSFQNNVAALSSYHLRMKVIHDITDPNISFTLWGTKLSMPVLAAPIGGTSYNMGEKSISEEKYIMSMVHGCLEAGTLACTGDGPLDSIFEVALEAVKSANGKAIPFIKPWNKEEAQAKIRLAVEAGCSIVGMDVDAVGLVTLKKMGKPVVPKNVNELRNIAKFAQSLGARFVVKGIMSVEDALHAVDAGVDGIVVSNHGGRVLDQTPGTACVLPIITDAVKGQVMVLVDGGIRSGVDVLKMLALGADAVFIGRPCSIAVVGDPQNGLPLYLESVKNQLVSAMILTGTPDIKSAGRQILE